MPLDHRGQWQFITASMYRRTPLFLSNRFRHCFVHKLAGWRRAKPCDFRIDTHQSTESQSVALRQPAKTFNISGAGRGSTDFACPPRFTMNHIAALGRSAE
jgi:hypothetical protein